MSGHARVQRKRAGEGEREAAPPIAHEALRTGGGRLDEGTQAPVALQHALGQVTIHQATAPVVQPKLTVNEPGDIYEQEADRVADQVMRMPDPAATVQRAEEEEEEPPLPELAASQDEPSLQRSEAEEEPPLPELAASEDEPSLQRSEAEEEEPPLPELAASQDEPSLQRSTKAATPEVTLETEAMIGALHGRGQPLDEATRAFMEPRFGADFGQVRIHADAAAAQSAAALSARAYTVGRDIAFGAGQYQPGTDAGRRLLAHELTHVVQQGSARAERPAGAHGAHAGERSGTRLQLQPAGASGANRSGASGRASAQTGNGGVDWATEYARLREQIAAGGVRKGPVVRLLLRAIRGISLPPPLRPRTPSPHQLSHQLANSLTSGRDGALADTSSRAAYRNPDDYWSWITFTPEIIHETEAHTQSLIRHELQHCADLTRDYEQYRRAASAPSEDGFVAYVQAHSGSSWRHMEVYSQQAEQGSFHSWTSEERLRWLEAALHELPPDVPADTAMAIEGRVGSFYRAAPRAQKEQIFNVFTIAVVDNLLRGDPGVAASVLNHFDPVWADGDHQQKRARWLRRVAGRRPAVPQTLQRTESGSGAASALAPAGDQTGDPRALSPEAEATVAGLRAGGHPLSPEARSFMEPRFGVGFGHVRVHTGDTAARSAREVGALAYTVGRDIVFGAGQYKPGSDAGRRLIAHELAHVMQQEAGLQGRSQSPALQRNSGAGMTSGSAPASVEAPASGPNMSVATPADFERRATVDHALSSGDPDVVMTLSARELAYASDEEKFKLIGILLQQRHFGMKWVANAEEYKIEQIWQSFGPRLAHVVTEERMGLWEASVAAGADLEDLGAVRAISDRFAVDVRQLATNYLFRNRETVLEEVARLGLSVDGSTPQPPATAEQTDQIARLQVAAAAVAKLQRAQEAVRGKVLVGYQMVTTGRLPWAQPVLFDPYKKPELQSGLDGNSGYIPGLLEERITPYDEVKAKYDLSVEAINHIVTLYPAIYAISREGRSADTAAFAGLRDSGEARRRLGEAFIGLLGDIERTQIKLQENDIDPLDLAPIHAQLLGGTVNSASPVRWSAPLPKKLAEQQVKDHHFANVLEELGWQVAAQAAFLVAPFTGGASLYVALAGLAILSAKAQMSAEHFTAMAEAAKTSVNPGTELVYQQQVDQARAIKEADEIAFVLAVLGVAAEAAISAIRSMRPRIPPQAEPVVSGQPQMNPLEQMPFGKAAEGPIIRRYFFDAHILPENYPAFDAVRGGNRFHRIVHTRSRGKPIVVVEETIEGGEWISIKRLETTATPEKIGSVVRKAADDIANKRGALRDPTPCADGVYLRVMEAQPERVIIHLESPVPVTAEIQAAARNALPDYGFEFTVDVVVRGP